MLVVFIGNAQNKSMQGIDSLKTVFQNERRNPVKSKLLETITCYYLENDLDAARVYLQKTKDFSHQNKLNNAVDIELLDLRVDLSLRKLEDAIAKIAAFKKIRLSKCNRAQLLNFKFLEISYYKYRADYDTCLKLADKVLNTYKGDTSNIMVDIYNAHSNLHLQKLNQKIAFESIEKAIALAKKNNYQSGLSVSYLLLSYNYSCLNQFDKALEYANLVNKSKVSTKSLETIIREKLGLGTMLFYTNDFKKAAAIIYEVVGLNKKLQLNNIQSIAIRYINLANFELGNYSVLTKDLKEQLITSETYYDKYSAYYQLVFAHNKIKDYATANVYLESMKTLMDANNASDRDVFEYIQVAIVTNKGLGNINKVFELSEMYNAKYKFYNDNLNAETVLKNQIAFETKEKEIALNKLTIASQKDKITINKITINKKENQKNILIAIAFFGLLLGTISYFLYLKIKKKNYNLQEQNKLIELQNIEIKNSNATIKKTFSIISHDLRGPFNVLLGFTNYINDNFDECSKEELQSYIIKVNNAAQNNFNFTQQLLNWSLKQQNGITIHKELCNLNEVVEKSIATLLPLANQKDIAIYKDYLLEDTAKHYLDKDIIFKVLYNVISNSIKYSKEGAFIKIKTYADEQFLTIEIKDNGMGMTNEQLQKLNKSNDVNEFNFIKNNNKYQGGFGLTYAKELVTIYGGQLIFNAVLGAGTTVIFKIKNTKLK
jgi:signal transduction histidine kinase